MSELRVALRLGRWQDVLRGVTCDALIADPPYSERTATGQRGCRTNSWLGSTKASGITYGGWSEQDVHAFVASWVPRTRRWFVMFGDHLTTRWALEALIAAGWYDFPPVPWTKTGAAPRIAGDGPSPQAEYLAIARPRRRMVKPELRYRPGWYHGTGRRGAQMVGAKPLWLMEGVLRDYSEPGDVVCDPCAGLGTTLLAARELGRHAIGAERDPQTHARAMERLARPVAEPKEAV